MAVTQETASNAGADPVSGPVTALPPFVVNANKLNVPSECLWELRKKTEDDTLPVLLRNGSITGKGLVGGVGANLGLQTVYSGAIKAVDPIDVVKTFPWTKSPQGASRIDVPSITLTERRLLMNSNISNIANSVYATTQNFGALKNTIVQGFNNLTAGTPQGIAVNEVVTSITDTIINSSPVKAAQELAKQADEFVTKTFDQFDNSVLTPYNFLYATESTGFVYNFPYFQNEHTSLSNSFDGQESNALTGVTNLARDIAQEVSSFTNLLKPGTYIEKAKQYSFGDRGRTIQIKFPLLNTGKYEDISRNWQLIYGLTYQNRPGRVTRSIIDMPVLYQAEIKGMLYMPYSFISNLEVSFLGNRRQMNILVPIYLDNNQTKLLSVPAVIPDAYEISITLEGLNEETRNFMFASINPTGVTVKGR